MKRTECSCGCGQSFNWYERLLADLIDRHVSLAALVITYGVMRDTYGVTRMHIMCHPFRFMGMVLMCREELVTIREEETLKDSFTLINGGKQ
jgi:hypothetical protein